MAIAVAELLEALDRNFATKDDLEHLATKENLSVFRGEVTADLIRLETKVDDLTERVDNLAQAVGALSEQNDRIELMVQQLVERPPPG